MFSRIRSMFRPPETKAADVLPAALFDFLSSGMLISAESAMRVPAVSAAIRTVAEAVATVPLKVYRTGQNGERIEDNQHPALRLINDEPNSWTSGFDLKLALTIDALTSDYGGVAWLNRIGGEIREVIRFSPGAVTVHYDAATGEPSYTVTAAGGGMRQLDPADVIHVLALGPLNRCPLSIARDVITTALRQQQHAEALFSRGARPAGLLKVPGRLSLEGMERLRAAWQAGYGGAENSSRTAILEDGVQWEPLTFNSVDLQFVELLKFSVEQIARAFRVPPSMLYHLDRATWSNSEQMGLEFIAYTLQPWLDNWRGALRRSLLTAEERAAGVDLEFEADDLSRASLNDRAVAYSSLIGARVLSPNEARAWEGLPPYSDGDRFANPHIDTSTPADTPPEPTPAAPKKRTRSSTKTEAAQ